MVYRTYRRRTVRRRTRPYRRRNRFGMKKRGYSKGIARRLTDSTVYAFKRTVPFGSIIHSGTPTSQYGAKQFQLNDLSSYTEFTTLFDSFKISGVHVRFIPRVTEVSTTTANFGQFVYNLDYNDVTPPSSAAELYERQSSKIVQAANRPFSLFVRPRVSTSVGTTTQRGSSRSFWVDTTSFDTPWYGFKWAWVNCNVPVQIDTYITYYMRFKTVK